MQMLTRHRPPLRRRRAGLRRDLRERAGRRAHLAPVPPGQPAPGDLVLGTGDLSELALGWSTYGVGDHMSHYNVNASVPKTLIQHLIRWVIADAAVRRAEPNATLQSILETEISPELVPATRGRPGRAGPEHRGQDRPLRAAGLQPLLHHAATASARARSPSSPSTPGPTASSGSWPEGMPEAEAASPTTWRRSSKWLEVFLFRFFQISQFKRSAVPNGPKVGSGGSLSPRGDWRAPSDSEADGLAGGAAGECA